MANTFASLFILALLVEICVDIIKAAVPSIRGYKSQLASIVLGVLITTATTTGFLEMLGMPIIRPWIDWFLTGLIISRGSNFLHDLITRIRQI